MRDITSSLAHAGVAEIHIWDNSLEEESGVYGRYRSVERATNEVVFVQDDDCLLPPESIRAIVDAYEPGRIVSNMPQDFRSRYTDSCLVGFGAVFDRDLPKKAFDRYKLTHYPWDRRIRPDVVFTALTPFTLVDVPFEHLPHAFGDNRMYRQAGHDLDRQITLTRARKVRAK